MENYTNSKTLIGHSDVMGIRVEPEDPTDNGGHPICYVNGMNNSGNARRIVAAWNYCAGIPTEDIEKMPLSALFFRNAYDGLQKDNSALQHENQCLRAAVAEMQRMLPVIEKIESGHTTAWAWATSGTGIATANAYRQTLEKALEKMGTK